MTSEAGRARRALVTGADGFLGRRLVRLLEERGVAVQRLDARRRPPAPSGAPEALYHLAGLANASLCDADPTGAFEANVALVSRMLEYCRVHGVPTFVLPSTGLVYGAAVKGKASETRVPQPSGMYAATKLAAESLLAGACARFGLAGACARLGNLYGPGVSEATVAGTVLAQLQKGLEPKVRDPRPVRDFLFVDDAAEGLLRLSRAAVPGSSLVVNVSTGRGASVAELLEEARRAAGLPPAKMKLGRGPALVLDNRRLARLTRWRPGTSLREGLRACLEPDHAQR